MIGRSGALLGALLAATLVSHSAAETGVTEREISIGSCSALEGTNKDLGTQAQGGARAFVDYLNKEKGGIHGRQIKIVSRDDQYEPGRAIECFNGLVEQGVFATGFFVGTPPSAKYVVMAQEKKIPAIGFSTGAPFLYAPVKRYVFSLRASYDDEAAAAVEHLWKDLGMRRIGLIMQDDAYGSAVMKGVSQALEKFGGSLAVTASYPRNTLDVDPAIARVRAADPEVVVLGALYVPAAEITKRAAAAGWKPRFYLFAGRDAYIKLAGAASEGTIWAQMLPDPAETGLSGVALFRKLMKKYSPDVAPDIKAFEAFVHARLMAEGLDRAGKDLTREKLVDALETIKDLDMGLGSEFHATFSKERHQANNGMHFVIVRNGKAERIKDWKSLRK